METQQFEALVARAIESLPEEFLGRLENIDIVVADEPTPHQLRRRELGKNQVLLGLYEGVPLTERDQGYTNVMPDKITIFQKAMESLYRTDARIVAEIQRTVRHELAHHFGIDDNRLHEIGRY
jgi:predicted Zn-dependent protease with MMP-like domain